jgi:hypothetical protein
VAKPTKPTPAEAAPRPPVVHVVEEGEVHIGGEAVRIPKTRPQAKKPRRLTQAARREEHDRRGRPYADNKSDLDSVAAGKMYEEYKDRPGYSLSSCRRTISRLRERLTGKRKQAEQKPSKS